jgi:hypothetical protein
MTLCHHAAVRIAALLTIGVIAALAPLAYADPPDPAWITGFWDDDDYDWVVIMVMGTSAVVDVAPGVADPSGSAVALATSPAPPAIALVTTDSTSSRAPPRPLPE